jgi:hypothetical protein
MFAYDDKKVHPLINEKATIKSVALAFTLENLGFTDGLDEKLQGTNERLSIMEWLRKGGEDEDNPLLDFPYTEHFHDPLKPWDQAGLDIPLIWHWGSSVFWSQMSISATVSKKNLYSWPWAREKYYQALISGDEKMFADTFSTLGRLTHLVSDLAVPAHVRNDSHPFKNYVPPSWKTDPYEIWTAIEGNLKDEYFVVNPGSAASVDVTIFNNAIPNSLAPVAVSALWDQDKYTEALNNPGITLSETVGLAEYTNANFFSKDTIYTYPNPSKENTYTNSDDAIDTIKFSNIKLNDIETIIEKNGVSSKRLYAHAEDGDGEKYKIASLGYFFAENTSTDGPNYEWDDHILDDNEVHADYAARLIPRAVGYSTALIDYFFRGTMEITPPDQFVYAVIDGGIVDPDNSYVVENGTIVDTQVFTKIKAKVRNISPFEKDAEGNPLTYETIGAGNLIAVARYKRRNDYLPDLANDPPQADSRESIYSYSVSAPVSITSLVTATAQEYPFDFSENPIPASITDLTLQVVFRGILGDEQDGIAVGMVDLNEPQHLTFWNDTDYFLLNGVPVKAEDSNDPYVTDPYSLSEDLGFSAEDTNIDPPVIATINSLPPGRYSRLIVLTDSDPTYYATNRVYTLPGNPVSVDYTVKYSMPIVINQKQIDGTWLFTPVSSVRGISQHFRWNHIDHYPIFEYVDTLPAPTENELGAYPVTISSP